MKPKNTGVSSLCLLQRIFLTQESNQSLLRCRWILYQLSWDTELLSNSRVRCYGWRLPARDLAGVGGSPVPHEWVAGMISSAHWAPRTLCHRDLLVTLMGLENQHPHFPHWPWQGESTPTKHRALGSLPERNEEHVFTHLSTPVTVTYIPLSIKTHPKNRHKMQRTQLLL